MRPAPSGTLRTPEADRLLLTLSIGERSPPRACASPAAPMTDAIRDQRFGHEET
jgi:hypothetical protein